jgi:hypothetical protein
MTVTLTGLTAAELGLPNWWLNEQASSVVSLAYARVSPSSTARQAGRCRQHPVPGHTLGHDDRDVAVLGAVDPGTAR